MKTARLRKTTRTSTETLEARIAPATFFVTNTNDTGLGSLRDAVDKANLTPALDTILFKTTAFGTILLTGGDLNVTAPLKVTGPGAGKVIISGGGTSRIFDINDGTDAKDSPFTLTGLTLTGGSAPGDSGGAIYSDETLTVKNSTLSANTADRGGAIFVSTSPGNKVLITGSTLTGNQAVNGWGGGLYLDTGKGTTILNTTIAANTAGSGGGGGYFGLSAGTDPKTKIVITGSIFRGNSTNAAGGGIAANLSTRAILITKTDISGNTGSYAGGLYLTGATLTMTGSSLIGNTASTGTDGGGGAYIFQSTGKITATRIIGNSSNDDGGGIVFDPNGDRTLTLTGGTVTGNSAAVNGGGIAGINSGKLIIKGTSFLANRALGDGGGIATFASTSLEITGGIYENNSASNAGAVDADGTGTVSIKAAKFLGNRASADGGALYLRTTTTAVIMSSLFNGNTAGDDGGAIMLGNNGTYTLTGLTILNSIAGEYGGGIVANQGTVSITKSLIKANYAGHVAGGISNFAALTITASVITGNFAKTNGGGLYHGGPVLPVLDATTKIFGNLAPVNADKNF